MTTTLRRSAAYSIVLFAVSSTLAACGGNGAEAAVDTTAIVQAIGPSNIATAREDTIRSGPPVSGTLVAEREARIRAEVSGAVLQTYVEQGQRVSAGTPLVRIDDAVARDASISARSQVTQATVGAEQAARELQRAKTLVAAGAIAERDVESAERANLAAQAQLADARARLAMAQKNVANATVRAPFNGVVSERAVNPGDVVSPGAPLVTIIDPRSLQLEASVPTTALGEIRVGAPVTFSVNGFAGRTLEGRVTRINPMVDPQTRQVRLLASVPNESGSLVAGLFVEGLVASEKRVGVIVPEQAIDQASQTPYVMRIKNGKVDRVQVQTGLRDAALEVVEIVSGIAVGDTVLLGAARSISAGTDVRVSAPTDAASTAAPAGKSAASSKPAAPPSSAPPRN